MSFGLIIFVKDETDLLIRNIEYHESIGVSKFFICNRGSTSVEFNKLKNYSRNKNNTFLYTQNISEISKNRNALENRRKILFDNYQKNFNTRWLAIIDADEFLVHKFQNIESYFPTEKECFLKIQRYNVALRKTNIDYDFGNLFSKDTIPKLNIITKPIKLSYDFMKLNPDIPWVMHKIDPKCMTNIKVVNEIAPGFHKILTEKEIETGWAKDLVIAHFPFSSFDRFLIKVNNIKRHLNDIGHTFKPNQAWHWKRWAQLLEENSINKEYEDQFFTDNKLNELKNKEIVQTIETHLNNICN